MGCRATSTDPLARRVPLQAQEKAAEKAQKRAERKGQREATPQERAEKAKLEYDEEGNPKPLDFHDF